MDFKEVPKGRVIPFYLTDEGDIYPIAFHSEEELDLIQSIVAGLLETVAVRAICFMQFVADRLRRKKSARLFA